MVGWPVPGPAGPSPRDSWMPSAPPSAVPVVVRVEKWQTVPWSLLHRRLSHHGGCAAGAGATRVVMGSSGGYASRGETYAGLHHVVLQQDGGRVSVRSLPNSAASSMGMDLVVDGVVLTGTWVEDTGKTGYYRGKRYAGGIQLVAGPGGSRLAGKWVGHGKDGDVNTGPWRLDFLASADRASVAAYDRPPHD